MFEPERESTTPERKPLSVSAAVNIAKSVLSEHTFHIIGEVSELNQRPGYKAVYFTIKDENSTLPCMMWVNRYKAAGAPLRLGARVEVIGKFTIFAPKGRMNFDVSTLRLAGEGDLRAQVAERAMKLRAEGLMDPARKRPVVEYPSAIGLVTSPRGAAVHDVLRTLRRRYPLAKIVFAGVPVEGKQASQDLIQGMQAVIDGGAEELLLVRGGGSFEDLMPFNDEALARFIASSPIPVITGIGHEPDTTIADMVADLRASTPTAAAEAVSPSSDELFAYFKNLGTRMSHVFLHRIERSINYVDTYLTRPLFRDEEYLLSTQYQLIDLYQTRLEQGLAHFGTQDNALLDQLHLRLKAALPQSFERNDRYLREAAESLRTAMAALLTEDAHLISVKATALQSKGKVLIDPYKQAAALMVARLNDLSPLRTLERGWSIAKNEEGAIITSVDQVAARDVLNIQVADGVIGCCVEDTKKQQLIPQENE